MKKRRDHSLKPFINDLFKKGKIKISNKNKKIYFKKFKEIAGFTIWLVHGEYVQDNISEDFVNIGQHYLFKFIPKNEFWISKEFFREKEFYVDHLLIENRLMKKGMSYDNAYRIAAAAQRRERMKSELAKKLKRFKDNGGLIKKIHKKLIYKLKNLEIWLVCGEIVRDELRIDFQWGGHDKVYHIIPRGEIWIDDDTPKNERKFMIIHELKERTIMEQKHFIYRKAHEIAQETEYVARKNPGEIKKILSDFGIKKK